MYQLAIFDLDGTLLDTLADLRQGLNYALSTQGFAPRTLPEVRAFVGNGIRKLIERAVPAGTDEAQIEAVFEAFNPYYAVHCASFFGRVTPTLVGSALRTPPVSVTLISPLSCV